MSTLAVLRYVVRIRTNVIVIVSSALGYFMFAGIRAFGLEFSQEHYGFSAATGAIGVCGLAVAALAGVVAGGRIADGLLARGHVRARIAVPTVAFFVVVAVAVPAFITTSLWLVVPLASSGAFALAVANPPLDAARLDVVPPPLWGRAEAVRATLRTALEALAPLLFGAIAQHAFGGDSGVALEHTFLLMLVPLLASPIVLLFALRSYPSDVASALASAGGDEDQGDARATAVEPPRDERTAPGARPSSGRSRS
jgi:hypothetical protein